MNPEDISKQGKELVSKVTNAVEKAGTEVASQVSQITNGKAEEITEEAIQTAVDQALNVLQVAEAQVHEKDMDGDRVTLQVGIGISGVAHLRITTDVASRNKADKQRSNAVDVEVS
ncbi:MAG: autotransporter outer membrane beta-barrel domain-containing protein [Phormidesmis sp.]